MPSRRRFLKSTGLGLSALYLQVQAIQSSLAEELGDSLKIEDSRLPLPDLSSAYSLAPGLTYLNHASIGTVPQAVQKAHRHYLELCESNPWLHMWGTAWKEPRDEVRARLADWLGCQSDELTFSHNTTETFNLLAQGLPLGDGDEVLFSSLNHSGASVCWRHGSRRRGFKVREFPFPVLDAHGLNTEDLVRIHVDQIRDETQVLVLAHVDNILGIRMPVREITQEARKRGVRWIAVDAAQGIGMLPVDLADLGVDVLATSPHKWLQAPKGLGLAYIKKNIQDELEPMWVTWGQKIWGKTAQKYEDYGTRNLAEVLTLGDALTFHQKLGWPAIEKHHRSLWQHLQDRVDAEPKLKWHAPRTWDLSAALVSIGFDGVKSSNAFQTLFQEHGFVFRPFEVQGLNAIRISPGIMNTTDELDQLVDRLLALL